MSTPAIRVIGLSKRFSIGERVRYKSLRESIQNAVTAPFRRDRRTKEKIWALRDVSFEVAAGEVVGVIGRNGAGKSTLLKVLSRITEPTEGRVELRGRVGSLLEMGTGFHLELTGRENIYLSGAILGMKRAEIVQRFDEIVAFAEIERFLDTPVKHYSTGMYLRLAFAVAAHLEPEILLVDEVLAVGDAAFQKKCLGKMGDVARSGRTVLFVSHNMAAVQRLCSQTMVLRFGSLVALEETGKAVSTYLCDVSTSNVIWERTAPPRAPASITRVFLADEIGTPVACVTTGERLRAVIEFSVKERSRNLQLGVGLLDDVGQQIFGTAPQDYGREVPAVPGDYRAEVTFPPEILLSRPYGLRVVLWVPGVGRIDMIDDLFFRVVETLSFSNATPESRPGLLAVRCGWVLERRQ